jgi:sugar porter (SP) family MFS transporter
MAPVAAAPIASLCSSNLDGYSGQELNAYVVSVALLAASGGLLFGYDLGVTGGVESMASFQKQFFPGVYEAEQDVSTTSSPYCTYNSASLQLFTSVLFLAGLISSPFASWTTTKGGRLVSMGIAAGSFLVGAGLNAGAQNLAMLYVGRIMLGIGVGFANSSVPVYLSESAPFAFRGALNQLFQLMTTIGILVAQLVNYGVRDWDQGWRLSLGLAAVPALILLLGAIILPESPNSLWERGHEERAEEVLKRLRNSQDVRAEIDDIREATRMARSVTTWESWRILGTRRYLPQLVVSVMVPLFQQFTGINAIMFYVPILFRSLGSGAESALLNTVIIGAVNVAATLVAIFSVDRLGRRFWFIEGGIQMGISMIVTAVVLAVEFSKYPSGVLPSSTAIGVLVVICVFVAAFAWSWGPLGWLVPSEIHPIHTRAAGMSLCVSVNFLFSFVIGQTFVSMLCAMEWGVFIFFAAFVVTATLFVILLLPETKGVPVEKVAVLFARHRLWRKMMSPRIADDIIAEWRAGQQAAQGRALEGNEDPELKKDDDQIERRTSSVWQTTYAEPNPFGPLGTMGSLETALSGGLVFPDTTDQHDK